MITQLISWLEFFIDMELDEATGSDVKKYSDMKRYLRQIDKIHKDKKYEGTKMRDIRV